MVDLLPFGYIQPVENDADTDDRGKIPKPNQLTCYLNIIRYIFFVNAYQFVLSFCQSFSVENNDSEDSENRDEGEEGDEMDAVDAKQMPNYNLVAQLRFKISS